MKIFKILVFLSFVFFFVKYVLIFFLNYEGFKHEFICFIEAFIYNQTIFLLFSFKNIIFQAKNYFCEENLNVFIFSLYGKMF